MTRVRVIVEYTQEGQSTPTMRWEKAADIGRDAQGSSFELMGRAFEAAQREEGLSFPEAIGAFLRGALIRKQDMTDVLTRIDERHDGHRD